MKIVGFFNRIGANKLLDENPDLPSILITEMFSDLDGAPNQDIAFHTVNPKYFQADILDEDFAIMRRPESPAVRSLPPFARATSATIAIKSEPGSNTKKRSKIALDLGGATNDADVAVVADPMKGIPHFGGRDQGKIRTVHEIIKITNVQLLENIILNRNHALAYEAMANVAGAFFDVDGAFDFDIDSEGDAANRLVKDSTISKDISLINDLNNQYKLQVKDIPVPNGISSPDFIQVEKIPNTNLYFIKLLMSESGKRSGTVCVYLPWLRTVCICTNDDKHTLDGKAGKKNDGSSDKIPINWYTFRSTDCQNLDTFTRKLAAVVFPSGLNRGATFTICAHARVTKVVKN